MKQDDMDRTLLDLPSICKKYGASTSTKNQEIQLQYQLSKVKKELEKLNQEETYLDKRILEQNCKHTAILFEKSKLEEPIKALDASIKRELEKQKNLSLEIIEWENRLTKLRRMHQDAVNQANLYDSQVEAAMFLVCKEQMLEMKQLEEQLESLTAIQHKLQPEIDEFDNLYQQQYIHLNNDDIDSNIDKANSDIGHLRQEIEIVEKKNAAQLIRLKRQVEEFEKFCWNDDLVMD